MSKKNDENKAEKEAVKTSEDKTIKEEGTFSISQFCYDWIGSLLFAGTILLLIMAFFLRQVTVRGGSMNDTLKDKDRLIVSSFMYTPQDGDIIVATHGSRLNEPIIKRVIATEGQTLRIDYENNTVTVDGEVLDEPYIKGRTIVLSNPTYIPDVIPRGYVFVMGDNREDSLDSRSTRVGLIPVDNIIGKAVFRMWPFDSLGLVG